MFPLGGLLVLALDIYTIYLILQDGGDTQKQLLWIVLVILLPVVGPILYFLLGRGGKMA